MKEQPKWTKRAQAKIEKRHAEYVASQAPARRLAQLQNGELVPLKKVCALANVEPQLARRLLRMGGPRPAGRWEWPKAQVDSVVAFLKEKMS